MDVVSKVTVKEVSNNKKEDKYSFKNDEVLSSEEDRLSDSDLSDDDLSGIKCKDVDEIIDLLKGVDLLDA